MKWTKVKIECDAADIEIVCGILLRHGVEGVEIIDPKENFRFLNEDASQNWDYVEDELLIENADEAARIQFFLPQDDERSNNDILCGVVDALGNLGRLSHEAVNDDWSEKWLEFYKPFKIGERIIVRPFWEEYEPKCDEIVFTIDPGHVFGTGQHQSTALCIQLLEKHVAGGEKMLDIGCGSGILSIIALLLGANHATALDIDPQATKMTLVNAQHNTIDATKIETVCGNILADDALSAQLPKQPYQLITANIVADVIIRLAPIAAKMIAKGGKFIVGGIIDDRADEVAAALEIAGFKILDIMTQDNWVAYASVFC